MISVLLLGLLSASEPSALDYGEVYVEESAPRELPRFTGSVGYGLDLNDSFSDLHSVVTEAQIKLWKYVSTGLLFQYAYPHLSSAGSRLKSLEPALSVKIPQMKWGLFSVTELQFLLGSWNIMNLFPLQADFMVGGGAGAVNSRPDVGAAIRTELSFLWIVEQRFRFYKNAGIFFSVFGNTGGTFISLGATGSF